MKRKHLLFLALTLLCCLLLASTVAAQGTASIDRWVVAGGGGPANSGGGIALNGTLGQPIIGPSAVPSGLFAAGDSVTLGAGYWYNAQEVKHCIYLQLVLRGR